MSTGIIAVVGPTASGKTGLSIELASKFGGEIISCDSMQIYKGMDIGTAKPSAEEMRSIPHHLIGVIDTDAQFSVSDYVDAAQGCIADVSRRGKVPFLVGGTGLYARSLLYGVEYNENSRDDALRAELIKEAENGKISEIYEKLISLDPTAAAGIHINNKKRVIRALEYCLVTGEKFSEQCVMTDEKPPKYKFVMLGINYRNRSALYERINMRVDEMISHGLVEEASEYYKSALSGTSVQAIGYKELFPYFKGELSLSDAIENIKQETRHYAKRQLTWFNKEKNINWLYADDYDNYKELVAAAVKLIDESGVLGANYDH